MNEYNENGQSHGYWERYRNDGSISIKGNYVNGNMHGYWESYWSDGTIFYKGNFHNGKICKSWKYFDRKGEPIKKEFYL